MSFSEFSTTYSRDYTQRWLSSRQDSPWEEKEVNVTVSARCVLPTTDVNVENGIFIYRIAEVASNLMLRIRSSRPKSALATTQPSQQRTTDDNGWSSPNVHAPQTDVIDTFSYVTSWWGVHRSGWAMYMLNVLQVRTMCGAVCRRNAMFSKRVEGGSGVAVWNYS